MMHLMSFFHPWTCSNPNHNWCINELIQLFFLNQGLRKKCLIVTEDKWYLILRSESSRQASRTKKDFFSSPHLLHLSRPSSFSPPTYSRCDSSPLIIKIKLGVERKEGVEVEQQWRFRRKICGEENMKLLLFQKIKTKLKNSFTIITLSRVITNHISLFIITLTHMWVVKFLHLTGFTGAKHRWIKMSSFIMVWFRVCEFQCQVWVWLGTKTATLENYFEYLCRRLHP